VADIFQEVDEDVRRDKQSVLWEKYGKFVIAIAVVVIAATAATVSWREYSKNQMLESGGNFAAAKALVVAEKDAEAADAFAKLAADSSAGYAAIARLEEAAALTRSKNTEEALKIYDALGSDSSADSNIRQLAALHAASQLLDAGDSAGARSRLTSLIEAASPWRHSARELLGLAEIADGNKNEAIRIYKALSEDATTPRGARARAAEMLAALGGAE
jgi:hypothetical protein